MKASCSLQQPAMLKSVEVSRHKNCGYIATVCMHLMHLLIISDPDTFLSVVLYSSIHILDFTAQLPGYTSVCGVRGLDRSIYFHLNLKTDSINKKMFSSKADVTLISIYRIKFTTSLCVCVCVCIRLLAIVNYFLWFIHLERQAKKEIRTRNIQKDQLTNFLRGGGCCLVSKK